MIDRNHGWNVSLKPALLGYVFSLLIIMAVYRFVTRHHLTGLVLDMTVLSAGIGLALVQLVFFLHLGLESKPHWNTITFVFTVMVVIIIVGGSLWIMKNLSYSLMPKMQHSSPQERSVDH